SSAAAAAAAAAATTEEKDETTEPSSSLTKSNSAAKENKGSNSSAAVFNVAPAIEASLKNDGSDDKISEVNIPFDINQKHPPTKVLILHIAFMLAAWGLLIPSGICTAHVLRPHRTTETWFRWHLTLNTWGLLCASAGFLVALGNFSVFSTHQQQEQDHKTTTTRQSKLYYNHAVIGVFTMCLGLLQPLNALLGPSFKHPSYIRKTMTRQIHKALGVLACISAIVTIALGNFLVTFANILAPIYVGIVGFMLLVILCLWCDLNENKTRATVVRITRSPKSK
ncbi:hypothetical protein ACA910_009259, partial [Epithemia clementina (nom. ined.)]